MNESEYSKIINHITNVLLDAISDCGYKVDNQEVRLSISFTDKFADISSTIALKISKKESKNSVDVSKQIRDKITTDKYLDSVDIKNGFINFNLNRAQFSRDVMDNIIKNPEPFLRLDVGKGKKIIVEYPSVNPAHPLHIGHIRSALLGDTISNILEVCGYSVERQDYIDDLGLQSAQALWGVMNLEKIGIKFNPSKKYDHMLGDIYVAVNKKIKENPELNEDIKEISILMEQDGTYESKLLKDMVEKFIRSEYKTLFDLGVFHNVLIWESDILHTNLLEKALKLLLDHKITEKCVEGKYANCIVIDLNKLKNKSHELQGLKENVKVLVRSNNITGYLAKDIAFHMWKFGILEDKFRYEKIMDQPNNHNLYTTSINGKQMDFGNADISVNTIDSRQSYEQLLIDIVLKELSEYSEKELVHIPYGIVELESGALSGRKGTWIGFTADDLIEEARKKAYGMISEREGFSKEEKEKVSINVSLAAIRFEFIKIAYEKNITFSWERALNFEGNSGPYCQYMYTRAVHIINASQDNISDYDTKFIKSDVEFELIKKMSISKDIIKRAALEYRPNIVTNYLNDLSTLFSKFYEKKPVIKADSIEERRARIAIVKSFLKLSEELFDICGINRLERM